MILKQGAIDVANAFTNWDLWQGGGGGGGGDGRFIMQTIYQNIVPYSVGTTITVSDMSKFDILEFVTFSPEDGISSYRHAECATYDTFKKCGTNSFGYLLSMGYYRRCTIIKYIDDTHISISTIQADGESQNNGPIICQINGLKFAYDETTLSASEVTETNYGDVQSAIDSLKVKSMTFNVVTRANGSVLLPIENVNYIIVDIKLDSGPYFASYRRYYNGSWYVILEDVNGNRIGNTNVSGTINYIVK